MIAPITPLPGLTLRATIVCEMRRLERLMRDIDRELAWARVGATPSDRAAELDAERERLGARYDELGDFLEWRQANTCGHTGKIAHPSQAEAREAIPTISPTTPVDVYQCRHCGSWHVGHAGPTIQELRRAGR